MDLLVCKTRGDKDPRQIDANIQGGRFDLPRGVITNHNANDVRLRFP